MLTTLHLSRSLIVCNLEGEIPHLRIQYRRRTIAASDAMRFAAGTQRIMRDAGATCF